MGRITLYGFPQSTYTRTALMAAHEKGVEAELKPLAYGKPEHFALHPFGKMPILTHGETKLFETLAIVSYIDDTFDGSELIPRAALSRAETLGAISVAIDYAYRPVVHIEKEGDSFKPDQLEKACAALDWLQDAAGKDGHVVGASLTAADLFLAPMIDYHRAQVGDAMTFDQRPALRAWFDRIAARPSFVDTKAD